MFQRFVNLLQRLWARLSWTGGVHYLNGGPGLPPPLTPEEEKAGFPKRPVAKPGHEADLKKRTLTNLYNARPAWLDMAHKALDRAVAAAYGWAAAASWRSASLISTAVLHSSALAILKMIASVGMCSPRSTLPMCERSMPARCASDSCAMPRSIRSARTAAPKA